MTDATRCSGVRSVLPEYAAGALDAPDRAAVEAHLSACAACRGEADSFVDVADDLLLLAPGAEPPVGFESAVMERIEQLPRRRSRRRSVALLAAAAIVLAGFGAVLGRMTAPSSPSAEQAITLRNGRGVAVGTAYVREGNPGRMFLTMRYRADWRLYVETVSADGTVTRVGSLQVRDGQGSFGATSPVPIDEIRLIRMVDRDGRVLCRAEVSV